MTRASSGASAASRNARASTTLRSEPPGAASRSRARLIRARYSAGGGTAAVMRTTGSGPVGQSGGASVRRTSSGTSNAAGLLTSKGNAPNTIGASPDRSAACAARTSQ